MDFDEIINFYYKTNKVDFDVYEKHHGYISAFSDNLSDVYYNHIIPTQNSKSKELLELTKSEFIKHNRRPAVCILPISCEYKENISGLKNISTDVWMKFENSFFKNFEHPKEFSFKIIGKEYMNHYVDLFMRGFSSGVYGQLPPEYAIVEKLCFNESKEHLIAMAFYEEKPIGVVRAIIESDKSFIYAFAIPKENRFSGLTAKLLGSFIIKEILNRGAKDIFLQTESETVLERFYSSNGFNKIFTGKYYVEEE